MAEPINKRSEAIVQEIDKRAWVYALDNLEAPTEWDVLFIKNAMLIGSSIALESENAMLIGLSIALESERI